jgi:hypothetical protein
MMRKNVSLTELLNAVALVACFAGTIGFAIGYGKGFAKWVYLPVFPTLWTPLS